MWRVGRWISPHGTSALIHGYVWGWAMEWVFFFLEIGAAIVYYYGGEKMNRKTHEVMGLGFLGVDACGHFGKMKSLVMIVLRQLAFRHHGEGGVIPGRSFQGFLEKGFCLGKMFFVHFLFAVLKGLNGGFNGPEPSGMVHIPFFLKGKALGGSKLGIRTMDSSLKALLAHGVGGKKE